MSLSMSHRVSWKVVLATHHPPSLSIGMEHN